MFSFGGAGAGGGVRFNNDDVDDLFDSGDGVVSRDEPPDVTEAADDNDGGAAPAVSRYFDVCSDFLIERACS